MGTSCSPIPPLVGHTELAPGYRRSRCGQDRAVDWTLTRACVIELSRCLFWGRDCQVSITRQDVAFSQICHVAQSQRVQFAPKSTSVVPWGCAVHSLCGCFKWPTSTQQFPGPKGIIWQYQEWKCPIMTRPGFIHVLMQKAWFSLPLLCFSTYLDIGSDLYFHRSPLTSFVKGNLPKKHNYLFWVNAAFIPLNI